MNVNSQPTQQTRYPHNTDLITIQNSSSSDYAELLSCQICSSYGLYCLHFDPIALESYGIIVINLVVHLLISLQSRCPPNQWDLIKPQKTHSEDQHLNKILIEPTVSHITASTPQEVLFEIIDNNLYFDPTGDSILSFLGGVLMRLEHCQNSMIDDINISQFSMSFDPIFEDVDDHTDPHDTTNLHSSAHPTHSPDLTHSAGYLPNPTYSSNPAHSFNPPCLSNHTHPPLLPNLNLVSLLLFFSTHCYPTLLPNLTNPTHKSQLIDLVNFSTISIDVVTQLVKYRVELLLALTHHKSTLILNQTLERQLKKLSSSSSNELFPLGDGFPLNSFPTQTQNEFSASTDLQTAVTTRTDSNVDSFEYHSLNQDCQSLDPQNVHYRNTNTQSFHIDGSTKQSQENQYPPPPISPSIGQLEGAYIKHLTVLLLSEVLNINVFFQHPTKLKFPGPFLSLSISDQSNHSLHVQRHVLFLFNGVELALKCDRPGEKLSQFWSTHFGHFLQNDDKVLEKPIVISCQNSCPFCSKLLNSISIAFKYIIESIQNHLPPSQNTSSGLSGLFSFISPVFFQQILYQHIGQAFFEILTTLDHISFFFTLLFIQKTISQQSKTSSNSQSDSNPIQPLHIQINQLFFQSNSSVYRVYQPRTNDPNLYHEEFKWVKESEAYLFKYRLLSSNELKFNYNNGIEEVVLGNFSELNLFGLATQCGCSYLPKTLKHRYNRTSDKLTHGDICSACQLQNSYRQLKQISKNVFKTFVEFLFDSTTSTVPVYFLLNIKKDEVKEILQSAIPNSFSPNGSGQINRYQNNYQNRPNYSQKPQERSHIDKSNPHSHSPSNDDFSLLHTIPLYICDANRYNFLLSQQPFWSADETNSPRDSKHLNSGESLYWVQPNHQPNTPTHLLYLCRSTFTTFLPLPQPLHSSPRDEIHPNRITKLTYGLLEEHWSAHLLSHIATCTKCYIVEYNETKNPSQDLSSNNRHHKKLPTFYRLLQEKISASLMRQQAINQVGITIPSLHKGFGQIQTSQPSLPTSHLNISKLPIHLQKHAVKPGSIPHFKNSSNQQYSNGAGKLFDPNSINFNLFLAKFQLYSSKYPQRATIAKMIDRYLSQTQELLSLLDLKYSNSGSDGVSNSNPTKQSSKCSDADDNYLQNLSHSQQKLFRLIKWAVFHPFYSNSLLDPAQIPFSASIPPIKSPLPQQNYYFSPFVHPIVLYLSRSESKSFLKWVSHIARESDSSLNQSSFTYSAPATVTALPGENVNNRNNQALTASYSTIKSTTYPHGRPSELQFLFSIKTSHLKPTDSSLNSFNSLPFPLPGSNEFDNDGSVFYQMVMPSLENCLTNIPHFSHAEQPINTYPQRHLQSSTNNAIDISQLQFYAYDYRSISLLPKFLQKIKMSILFYHGLALVHPNTLALLLIQHFHTHIDTIMQSIYIQLTEPSPPTDFHHVSPEEHKSLFFYRQFSILLLFEQIASDLNGQSLISTLSTASHRALSPTQIISPLLRLPHYFLLALYYYHKMTYPIIDPKQAPPLIPYVYSYLLDIVSKAPLIILVSTLHSSLSSLSKTIERLNHGSSEQVYLLTSALLIDFYAIVNFPPCMLYMYHRLRHYSHLKHGSRFQLRLFLKDIGLPLSEALSWWAHSLPSMNRNELEYGVKHTYGKEGGRKVYKLPSCSSLTSLITNDVHHGCYFAHFSQSSYGNTTTANIKSLSIPTVVLKNDTDKKETYNYLQKRSLGELTPIEDFLMMYNTTINRYRRGVIVPTIGPQSAQTSLQRGLLALPSKPNSNKSSNIHNLPSPGLTSTVLTNPTSLNTGPNKPSQFNQTLLTKFPLEPLNVYQIQSIVQLSQSGKPIDACRTLLLNTHPLLSAKLQQSSQHGKFSKTRVEISPKSSNNFPLTKHSAKVQKFTPNRKGSSNQGKGIGIDDHLDANQNKLFPKKTQALGQSLGQHPNQPKPPTAEQTMSDDSSSLLGRTGRTTTQSDNLNETKQDNNNMTNPIDESDTEESDLSDHFEEYQDDNMQAQNILDEQDSFQALTQLDVFDCFDPNSKGVDGQDSDVGINEALSGFKLSQINSPIDWYFTSRYFSDPVLHSYYFNDKHD